MKQILIVHGWDGTPESDWYAWLKKELEKRSHRVSLEQFPDTRHPQIFTWQEKFLSLAQEQNPQEPLIVIGHSIGCQCLMRSLPYLNRKVEALYLVAPWLIEETYIVTQEDKETAQTWCQLNIPFEKLSSCYEKAFVFLSKDDPYVSYPLHYDILKNLLPCTIHTEEKEGHFMQSTYPYILEHLIMYCHL